jgi:transcriptional regulator with XRE-family HTH domain
VNIEIFEHMYLFTGSGPTGIMTSMSEELNRRIRAELKRRGLSERRAGQMMGLSPGTISAILTHPEQNPSPATCLRLAEFLGWDQDMVLELSGHRKPPTDRPDAESALVEFERAVHRLPIDETTREYIVDWTRRSIEFNRSGDSRH